MDVVDCGIGGKLTWMSMDRYGLGGLNMDEYG